jgi:hypothetical protein
MSRDMKERFYRDVPKAVFADNAVRRRLYDGTSRNGPVRQARR